MDAERLQAFLDMLPRDGWKLEGGCIRSTRYILQRGLIGCCPILAACAKSLTFVDNESNAEFIKYGKSILGLTEIEASLIAAAADCFEECDGDAVIRAKLLEHCGLQ